MKHIKLCTITGASCSGKTTLARALVDTGKFQEVVSFTSRAPREGEVEGVDYYFKTEEECKQLILEDKVVEHAIFKRNIYGILREELSNKLASGKVPLLVVEPTGLRQIHTILGRENVFSVYMDLDVLVLYERFLSRMAKDVASGKEMDFLYQAERVRSIQAELRSWKYACGYDHHIHLFTSDTKRSIVKSLVDLLPSDEENCDKSRINKEG